MAYEVGHDVRPRLWSELSWTLRRLETVAGRSPAGLDDDAAHELARLQYSLHLIAESLHGAHDELTEALACARDATAAVAEAALLDGWDAALPLVYEWRGALFRVRLARMLLTPPPPEGALEPAEPADWRGALASFGLTLAGCAAFVLGAVLAIWPLWAAGMAAVVAGFLVYRP